MSQTDSRGTDGLTERQGPDSVSGTPASKRPPRKDKRKGEAPIEPKREEDTEGSVSNARQTDTTEEKHGTGEERAEPQQKTADKAQGTKEHITQSNTAGGHGNGEHVTQATDGADAEADELTEGVAREETRAGATNRWILEGRRWDVDRRRKDLIRQGVAAGLTRSVAADHAWRVVLAEFPPPDVEPSTLEMPEPEPEEPVTVPLEPEAPEPTLEAEPEPDGLAGIGELPREWPTLPDNASLAVEVQWVQANRLRVRDGRGVDLSRALSPAPSHAALSWLETSLLYPSKWADITARATSSQEDDRESVRREKTAIVEVDGLLSEMATT